MNQKLLLATPVYDGCHSAWVNSVLRLWQDPPCPMSTLFLQGDSLVSRARNQIAAQFLDGDWTDLLFIDTDIIFRTDDVHRIMSHDEALVGGMCPRKSISTAWVANKLDGDTLTRPDGLLPVRYVGTGFMRIRRDVFDSVKPFCQEYTPDTEPKRPERDFFSVGVRNGRFLSEDYGFCQHYADAGGTVYLDTRIQTQHIGSIAYPISK